MEYCLLFQAKVPKGEKTETEPWNAWKLGSNLVPAQTLVYKSRDGFSEIRLEGLHGGSTNKEVSGKQGSTSRLAMTPCVLSQ